MTVTVTVTVTVIMAMMVIVFQQPCADEIDDETDSGDGNGLVEIDGDRRKEAQQAFPRNHDGGNAQHDCAGKAREIAEFSRPESETVIGDLTAGIEIGEC